MGNKRYKRNTYLKKMESVGSTSAGSQTSSFPVQSITKKYERKSGLLEDFKLNTWDPILWYPLALVFILMSVMSFSFGISVDEIDMNNLGKAIFNYLTTFGKDDTVLHLPKSIDKEQVLYLYGGGFDLLATLINKFSPLSEYTTRHLLNAWVGFLGIYFTCRIAMIVSGKRMAMISIFIMFLAPFTLAQSMNNPKDIPFMSAFIAAIYFFIVLMRKSPKLNWKDYIPLTLSLIAVIDLRAGGLIIIPIMFVFVFLNYFLNQKDFKLAFSQSKTILIVGVISYFSVSLLWPYAGQNPLQNPINAISKLAHFPMNPRQLYEGIKVQSDNLPAMYIIKSFIISNTYILLIGILLSPIFLGNYKNSPKFIVLLFLGIAFLVPFIAVIVQHSNVYNLWRHLLFVFPFGVLISAFFWEECIAYFSKGNLKWLPYGIIGVGLLMPSIFILRTYPEFISYYNDFVGGTKGAYGNYNFDIIYNGTKESIDWVKENENTTLKDKDTIFVVSNLPQLVGESFKGDKRVKVVWSRFPERSLQRWDIGIFHSDLIPLGRLKKMNWLIKNTVQISKVEDFPICITVKRPSMEDYIGLKLLAKGNPMGVEHLLQYRKVDPDNELVNSNLFQYYFNKMKLDSARIFLNEVNRVEPESLSAQLNTGLMMLSSGDASKSMDIFNNLLDNQEAQSNPAFIYQVHFYRAQNLISMKQYQSALEDLQFSAQIPNFRKQSLQAMLQIYTYLGNSQMVQKINSLL